jgi:hypothetical protein
MTKSVTRHSVEPKICAAGLVDSKVIPCKTYSYPPQRLELCESTSPVRLT